MKLYEMGPSRSARIVWMLKELGLEYESVPMDYAAGDLRRPEFLAINPAGKVPVLEDDGFVLSESAAILIYLAEKHPEKALLPADPKERADALRWMFFCATELEQPLWQAARHGMLYPPEKRVSAILPVACEEFKAMAAVVDARLQGREYLVGSRFSVADLIVAWTLDWGTMQQWLSDFPGLVQYVERIYQRPAAPKRMAEAFAAIS